MRTAGRAIQESKLLSEPRFEGSVKYVVERIAEALGNKTLLVDASKSFNCSEERLRAKSSSLSEVVHKYLEVCLRELEDKRLEFLLVVMRESEGFASSLEDVR